MIQGKIIGVDLIKSMEAVIDNINVTILAIDQEIKKLDNIMRDQSAPACNADIINKQINEMKLEIEKVNSEILKYKAQQNNTGENNVSKLSNEQVIEERQRLKVEEMLNEKNIEMLKKENNLMFKRELVSCFGVNEKEENKSVLQQGFCLKIIKILKDIKKDSLASNSSGLVGSRQEYFKYKDQVNEFKRYFIENDNKPVREKLSWGFISKYEEFWNAFLTEKMVGPDLDFTDIVDLFKNKKTDWEDYYINVWNYQRVAQLHTKRLIEMKPNSYTDKGYLLPVGDIYFAISPKMDNHILRDKQYFTLCTQTYKNITIRSNKGEVVSGPYRLNEEQVKTYLCTEQEIDEISLDRAEKIKELYDFFIEDPELNKKNFNKVKVYIDNGCLNFDHIEILGGSGEVSENCEIDGAENLDNEIKNIDKLWDKQKEKQKELFAKLGIKVGGDLDGIKVEFSNPYEAEALKYVTNKGEGVVVDFKNNDECKNIKDGYFNNSFFGIKLLEKGELDKLTELFNNRVCGNYIDVVKFYHSNKSAEFNITTNNGYLHGLFSCPFPQCNEFVDYDGNPELLSVKCINKNSYNEAMNELIELDEEIKKLNIQDEISKINKKFDEELGVIKDEVAVLNRQMTDESIKMTLREKTIKNEGERNKNPGVGVGKKSKQQVAVLSEDEKKQIDAKTEEKLFELAELSKRTIGELEEKIKSAKKRLEEKGEDVVRQWKLQLNEIVADRMAVGADKNKIKKYIDDYVKNSLIVALCVAESGRSKFYAMCFRNIWSKDNNEANNVSNMLYLAQNYGRYSENLPTIKNMFQPDYVDRDVVDYINFKSPGHRAMNNFVTMIADCQATLQKDGQQKSELIQRLYGSIQIIQEAKNVAREYIRSYIADNEMYGEAINAFGIYYNDIPKDHTMFREQINNLREILKNYDCSNDPDPKLAEKRDEVLLFMHNVLKVMKFIGQIEASKNTENNEGDIDRFTPVGGE